MPIVLQTGGTGSILITNGSARPAVLSMGNETSMIRCEMPKTDEAWSCSAHDQASRSFGAEESCQLVEAAARSRFSITFVE